jgi:uncharacterized coiled-coil protein SlyX
MIVDTKDLDVAHKAYTEKKLMRDDMFRIVIDNIKADREKIQALREDLARQSATIGTLSAELAGLKQTVAASVAEVDARVAAAASAAITIYARVQDGGGDTPAAPARRGRPPLKAVEGA